MITRFVTPVSLTWFFIAAASSSFGADEGPRATDHGLVAGFAEVDITPALEKTVYMAGFGQNRKATKVHDPLGARAVVFQHAEQKVAIVSVDLVGFFHASVERVRQELPGFLYVLVSSTHNHEGPDTLGLWGPNPFVSGIDRDYLKLVESRIVQAVRAADKAVTPVTARIGTAKAPELLHDNREPYLKHDELVALQFVDAKNQPAGLIVQWNCHPETLSSKNTEISSDFVGPTVNHLRERYRCPVVYLTGTVGGLMTSLNVAIQDGAGKLLADGTFAKTTRYGQEVGQLAEKALRQSQPIRLTPLEARSRPVYLPLTNRLFQFGRQVGVLKRQAYLWTGDDTKAELADDSVNDQPLCLRTEVAHLRLGELEVAAVPGEIYPELVLDKVQDPADPAADFPASPIEPAIYKQFRGPHHLLIGLANDEIGYILPKRQWDAKPPYCYARKKAQYGEINSLGPDTAPILCKAFQKLVNGKK